MSLGRLCQHRGKCDDDCRWLTPVLAWFDEGFGTGDHDAARQLLDELEGPIP